MIEKSIVIAVDFGKRQTFLIERDSSMLPKKRQLILVWGNYYWHATWEETLPL